MKALKSAVRGHYMYIQRTKRIYRRGHTEQREYTGSIPSTQNWSSIREVKKTELQRKWLATFIDSYF